MSQYGRLVVPSFNQHSGIFCRHCQKEIHRTPDNDAHVTTYKLYPTYINSPTEAWSDGILLVCQMFGGEHRTWHEPFLTLEEMRTGLQRIEEDLR